MIADPVFAPSTLNWTLATATSSDALAVTLTVPENVALAAGAVMETVGGVVSAAVANVRSPLAALWEFASVEWTR